MESSGDGKNMLPKNYFLNLSKMRKTTYEFTDKKIKNSDIKKILEVARWAPSFSNVQPWHFIVVKNKKKISELVKIVNYGGFHTTMPLIIAIALDAGFWNNANHSGIQNLKLGAREAYLSLAMPALSMAFEAEELGIQSCFLTPESDKASKILKLGKEKIVPLIVGFGYEKSGSFQKKRVRKSLKELVSYEYYGGRK